MERDPRTWIDALRRSHDRLAGFVAGLDDDALGAPSMCTEWTVAQVLSHIGSGGEIGLATLEASITGGPPPGDDFNPGVWARWNDKTPRGVADDVAVADDAMVERLESLDDAQLAALEVKLPFMPQPIDVATAVGFRLHEHALHSWDVFAAFEPEATVAPEATALLVDWVPRVVEMMGRFLPRETRPPGTATIAVTTTSPDRRLVLEVGDAMALRTAGGDETTDGTLVIPAEALIRLVAGRLRPDRPAGDAEITGPISLDDLRRSFPGY
jgi:uncharacterized protein (TIGR03083 family)